MPYWLLEEIDSEGIVPPAFSHGEFAKDGEVPEGAKTFTVKRMFERAVVNSEKNILKTIDKQIKAEEAEVKNIKKIKKTKK